MPKHRVKKQHLIRDKKGNVVKVLPWPWEDNSDRPSDDPTGGGGFSGGGGTPPPTLAPGEAIFKLEPVVNLITGSLSLNANAITKENDSWCFPNGKSALNLELNPMCCGCQYPNFNLSPPCSSPATVSGCPGNANGSGGAFSGLGYCAWQQGGWPFQTVTIKGRIYCQIPGQLEHCLNVGSLDVRWNTQSSHYGANHVQPTISGGHGTFSNLQTPTYTQIANPALGPYTGDAVDFEITHTGMHDSGFPHTPAPSCTWCNHPDPAGNQSIIIEGMFTTSFQMFELTEVTYSTPGGNHTFDPFVSAWTHTAGTGNFPAPPLNPSIQPNMASVRFGLNFYVNSPTNTVLYDNPCAPGGALLASTFNSWPYAYKENWYHDPNDPAMIYTNAITNPPPFPIETPPIPPGTPWIMPGTIYNLSQLNDLVNTHPVWGPWVSSTVVNYLPPGTTHPSKVKMRNTTAHLDYPNQASWCEWKTDYESALANYHSLPPGPSNLLPRFTSPIKPLLDQNGHPLPGPPNTLGLQAHEVWGYTTAQMEDEVLCGCCHNLVDPGPTNYPLPQSFTATQPAVWAEWVMW